MKHKRRLKVKEHHSDETSGSEIVRVDIDAGVPYSVIVEHLKSQDGATATCPKCGTHYDLFGVDITDVILPVGDGCDYCSENDDDGEDDDIST